MDLGSTLIDELGLQPPACIALVGAGGKTTLMRALYAAARARGWAVVATTTTRVWCDEVADLDGFEADGVEHTPEGDKWIGLPPERIRPLGEQFVIVEADGARGARVKAPASHEPVIPPSATQVIAVIAADALDRVIVDVAHRPMLVGAVSGTNPYHRLTVDRAARLLTSDRGGRKDVPEGANFAVAVTRIGPAQRDLARSLAEGLRVQGIPVVLLADLDNPTEVW